MVASPMQHRPPLASLVAPEPLRNLAGWLVWKFVQMEDEPKPRKMPYYVAGGVRWGGHGSERDRRQLTTFEVARAAAQRRGFDGVGLALMPEWGICALDFDDCVINGEVHPRVMELVRGTYAEFSPSGKGVRAFIRAEGLGNRSSKKAGHDFGIEIFNTKGFVTFTGNRLQVVELLGDEDTVAPISPTVQDFCVERFGRVEVGEAPAGDTAPLGIPEEQLRAALEALPKDLEYDEWLRVGMALHHETQGERFDLWDETFSTSSKYAGSEYGQAKWDSFGRGGQRPTTVHALLNLAAQHGFIVETAALALDDFDVIDTPPPEPARASRFRVLSDEEFMARPAPGWIIKGVIPRAEVVMLFGESTAGKSFVALDLFAAVARGVPWRGHKVRQGRVVYVAAEGAGGFRNRMVAYREHHRTSPGLQVIDAAPNLLSKDEALEVSKQIVEAGGADVVVIDTLAQTTPGANENAAEDMGKALGHCRGIHRATGALVVLIHHAGKDTSKGARGWSGLKGAADAELEVARTPAGRVMRNSKQKDGQDGQQWGFALDVVQIGADEDGEPITSCVVSEAAVPVVTGLRQGSPAGPVERAVVEAISEMAVAQNAGIEISAVLDAAAAHLEAPTDGKRDTRRQRCKRALERLAEGDESPYYIGDDGTLAIV